jgi:glutamate N-acetyltransferase/amino-acid N-acetyltransferase
MDSTGLTSYRIPENRRGTLLDTLRTIPGGITAPEGFRAGSTACGIKADATTPDLAILAADVVCVATGTFTTNRAKAAPVILCQENLAATGGRAQAVIVNSGNANCATGEPGLRNARRMAELTAARLGIAPQLVLVSSTGIIGRQLPMEKIEAGISRITLSTEGGNDFATAILTTDTRTKMLALEFAVAGRIVRLAGTTKGAGMIYPNMATMLCYITTDAAIEQPYLAQILREAVDDSFNMIAVDGDMSTNDTVLCFASGLAGNTPLTADAPDAATFVQALRHLTTYLAREIARDGEGATKLMEVRITGAPSRADARRAARAITLSPLWQCALAGGDPNWGRIMAALGASGANIDPNQADIFLDDVQLVAGGMATSYSDEAARQVMARTEVIIGINLHQGSFAATAWGCDLTHGYIDENTLYHR